MTFEQNSHQERALCILGSTGSIGQNTLDIAQALQIPVHTLTAHSKVQELAAQALKHNAQRVVIADDSRYNELKTALNCAPHIDVRAGADALAEVAGDSCTKAVMTAIVGAAGLPATLAAVRAGKRVCIANKEPLVMAGELIMAEAAQHKATILPVDSEHSAIFQCWEHHQQADVEKIILTASGGPFRDRDDLSNVTLAEALKHPNWDMGPKITIDSATMMNKALEVIEAHHLFAIPVDQIEIMVHPQSVVHSCVAFADGSLMAQMGEPDMRTPIQYSLTWPWHKTGPVPTPNLAAIGQLDFRAPDPIRFPAVNIGHEAARLGGVAPTVANAVNEVAVARFLAEKCHFQDIVALVEQALSTVPTIKQPSLDDIIAADQEARHNFEALQA